jgi:hypothetical protein
MSTAPQPMKRLGLLAVLLTLTALLLAAAHAASAQAAVGPQWKIDSMSDTATAPGDEFEYIVEARNVGDEDMDGTSITLTATLPPGLVAKSGKLYLDGTNGPEAAEQQGQAPIACEVTDTTHLACINSTAVPTAEHRGNNSFQRLRFQVEVEPGAAEGILVTSFAVSGGGAGAGASTIDPTTISSRPLGFGIDAFDNQYLNAAGQPETAAAVHPADLVTSFDINSHFEAVPLGGTARPVEPLKDASVELPPGFAGNPTVAPELCTIARLAAGNTTTECPPSSQLGTVLVRYNDHAGMGSSFRGPLPLFALEAPPGVAARFGFNVAGTIIVLDASIRSDGDYGITTGSTDTSEGLPVVGASFDLWGNPFSEAHRSERACPGTPGQSNEAPSFGAPSCSAETEEVAFLRNPTSCQGPQASTIQADSWFHPEVVAKETSVSHLNPGYPYAPAERGPEFGFEECAAVPFSPSLEAAPPAGAQAGRPTSFNFDLKMPQQGLDDPSAISESDLRKAVVTLPAGVRVNPSSADGLGSCTPAQVGLTTPVGEEHAHFSDDAGNCPENAKIGSLSIETPLLDHEVPGAVYLAQQGQNPFGSLLALYFVAHDPISGVNIKQAVKVGSDPGSGQLTTTVEEIPQLPFTNLHIALKTGQRAALTAPNACGTYTTHSTFTGWSGKVVQGESSFTITQACGGGFDPKLSAGTQNPLAGTYSPFSLRLTREDGTQEIGALSATLPKGLIGKPAGIPYCSDAALAAISGALGTGAAQEANPSCPAASQLGTVTVGAGAGTTPFYTSSGRAYLAGPYKGAPLSLAVVTPAVAGPFDLGSVVVRNALRIDPETTQVTAVSDPLPSILYGIPLDLRDIRVSLNRSEFTLNPTSCEPMSIAATVTSVQGASASPSSRFQAANCDRLGFKPKLGLKLKGATKRSGNPALTAVLRARKGDANIGRVQVALPHSEFLAQSHIRTICTRVQFAAGSGGGAECPKGSIYGKVSATSPLVDYPLTGNVYLRSSSHPLPDMVLALHGPPTQPLQVDAVGRIDSVDGGIRTTFATVPDAPLTKVVLRMPGGKKSLLENSTNICRSVNKASVDMDAHNGKAADFAAPLQARCGEGKKGKAGRRGHG